jgi:tetratricopeptide (TPR) repeat protein
MYTLYLIGGDALDRPFPAYVGTEPYVFVCYAHADAAIVYADLNDLKEAGINLWYDEGISAGKSWRAEIAAAIASTSKLLFYISKSSLVSKHCLREVDYALTNDIEILPIYLDDSSLPGELELVLNRVHALFQSTDSMYLEHLVGAIREQTTISKLRTRAKAKRSWLPIAAIAIIVLASFVWIQRGDLFGNGEATTAATSSPTAFDEYLQGMELAERWDKDDNLDLAIELFQKAIELDPNFALAYARLGESLRIRYALTRDQIWLDEAIASVDEALRLNAGLAPVQVALGRLQVTRGNLDLAVAALEQALAIDPNDAAANAAMATVLVRLGRLEDAEMAFQKSISLEPDRLKTLDSYGNFLFRQSRFDEAARQWQTLVRLAPDHYSAFVNLGSAFSESGRTAEAITAYERAMDIKPAYMGYVNLGTVYARAARFEDAVEVYLKAIELDDSDWLAYGNLGYTYSWIDGKKSESAAAFERAIQLGEAARQENPRDPFVHSDLGLYYAKTGETEQAIQRAGSAIALSPDTGEIVAAAAEVYEVSGQRDKAIELARKSFGLGIERQHFMRNPDLAELMADSRMQIAH